VQQWVDDGVLWRPLIGGQVLGYAPPLSGTLTGFNQGGAVLTQLSGALSYTGTNDGGGTVMRGFMSNFSSTTAFIEGCIQDNPPFTSLTSNAAGVCAVGMRESSTQKAYWLSLTYSVAYITLLEIQWFSADATRTTVLPVPIGNGINGPFFFRVRRDASNIYADVSRDRVVWQNMDSRSLASVFTTAPNQVGLTGFGFNLVPSYNLVHMLSGSL
jgi:hypothetical protein